MTSAVAPLLGAYDYKIAYKAGEKHSNADAHAHAHAHALSLCSTIGLTRWIVNQRS